jgi:hypothetical protein
MLRRCLALIAELGELSGFSNNSGHCIVTTAAPKQALFSGRTNLVVGRQLHGVHTDLVSCCALAEHYGTYYRNRSYDVVRTSAVCVRAALGFTHKQQG